LEATKQWNPVVTGVYTFTSGDQDKNTRSYASEVSREKWTAWDPMFENQAGGTIYNTLFDLSNAHIYTVIAQVNPIEDVTTKVTWTGLWLDKKFPSSQTTETLRQPDGGTISGRVTTDKEIGHEIDAQVLYGYTEDVTIGASLGWFLPGDVFHGDNDAVASQALVNVDVNF
jgi:hypothetical protein